MLIILLCFSPSFNLYFLTTIPEIGWEERLRYDLFSVKWDVKLQLIDQLRLVAVRSIYFISFCTHDHDSVLLWRRCDL